MARTPDVAGALAAIVARTIKSTLGPRLRKFETRLKRLEKGIKKIGAQRVVRARGAAAGKRRGRRGPGRPARRGRRARR
jgi:hypothetical protein